jgi:hypothetical protein
LAKALRSAEKRPRGLVTGIRQAVLGHCRVPGVLALPHRLLPKAAPTGGTRPDQGHPPFISDWFAGLPWTDINYDGVLSVQDIFDFLTLWFHGC